MQTAVIYFTYHRAGKIIRTFEINHIATPIERVKLRPKFV